MIHPVGNAPLLPGTLKNLFFPPEKLEYTYFARAQECPFLADGDLARAAWAADAAMLAYARYGSQPMPASDFTSHLERGGLAAQNLIGNWKAPGTQGYFATNDQFAILAFRGTEADDKVDLFSDLDFLLVHEPDHRPAAGDPKPALAHLSLIEHLLQAPCLVHRGFQRALEEVWDEIHDCVTNYRRENPQAEICFTGHSLGAALAVLAFSRFGDPTNSLITFGCPRVGNAAFGTRVLSERGKGIFRYVNLNDPVTHVPLESYFYRHAPENCLRFDENGNLGEDNGSFKGDVEALRKVLYGLPADFSMGLDRIDAPPGVVDHSPARYCIRLWNCL